MPFAEEGERRSAVVLCDGPGTSVEERACLEFLAGHLAAEGVATTLIESIDQAVTVERVDLSVKEVVAAIEQTAAHPSIHPERIGLLGIGIGAGIASVASGERPVARLCLVGAVAAELAARRPDAEDEASPVGMVTKRLGQRQPLKCFTSHAGAALVLHGAADASAPPEHSLAYAAAREFTERPVDFHQVAFADHAFTSEVDREVLGRVIADFFKAMAMVDGE
jgi:dienelactone hydrolase